MKVVIVIGNCRIMLSNYPKRLASLIFTKDKTLGGYPALKYDTAMVSYRICINPQ